MPTLLALTDDLERMNSLASRYAEALPDTCYAHLSPGVEELLAKWYDVEEHGRHVKMGLRQTQKLLDLPQEEASCLTSADLPEVTAFYERSYPGNWFDPRMLETGQYYGLREKGALVSVAGVHVYSPRYRVAALGNIATLPHCRGRGLARRVTTAVCCSLLRCVDHIGLNVKADNEPAIHCYRKLGFEPLASYGEFSLRRRES